MEVLYYYFVLTVKERKEEKKAAEIYKNMNNFHSRSEDIKKKTFTCFINATITNNNNDNNISQPVSQVKSRNYLKKRK